MITKDKDAEHCSLILEPNRSATWQESKYLILAMLAILATIAIGWLIVGVWMILPFAGIEIGLFATLTYMISRQTYRQQIITLTKSQISIENKLGRHKNTKVLSRCGCWIDIIETERDWNLPELYLMSNEQRYEIGHFLNLKDRQTLSKMLQQEGIPNCRTFWWKTD